MKEEKKLLKEDINFLEYPNWTLSRKKSVTTYNIKKDNGTYEVISPFGLPKHFDKIVVYFLLYKLCHSKASSYTLITSRYEIAKNIFGGNHFGKNVYDRIMRAIKRWKSIAINFEGLFYYGDGYTIRGFSVIDEYILRKDTGELIIKFSESYVKQLQETTFYKLIDFEQYKILHKASSARLYELLCKSFKARNEWAINIQSLAEKLTFEKRKNAKLYYPSDVLRYLKPGIKEINKKTDLAIKFEYNKKNGICLFKKAKKQSQYMPAKSSRLDKSKMLVNKKQAFLESFKVLSQEEQDRVKDAASRDQFLKYLTKEDQIVAYMAREKK